MKGKIFTFIPLALLLALFVAPVYAGSIPSLPHAFYGAVELNGSMAPVGTQVEVRGEGVQTGVNNNPFVTSAEGVYGGPDALAPKLIVQGSVTEGAILTFYVNGVRAEQTTAWHSGEVTELDLTATAQTPPAPVVPPTPATPPAPEAPAVTPVPPTPEAPPTPATPPAPSAPPAVVVSPQAPPLPPSPSASAEPINWTMLWSVIGGAMGLILIILMLARRRAY
jgi:hypothetical protein